MKILHLFAALFFSFISSCAFCQYDSIRPQGIYTSNFTIDEKPRNITYYMPLRYGKEESYSLLIVLHDEKSSAKNMIKKYGDVINAKADSTDCIVLYPDAYNGHWNGKEKTGVKDSVNDVGFISIMLEFFVKQFGCDVNQVYLAGIGSGGDLCYRFACESVYKPVAIAGINATADKDSFQDCRNRRTIPGLNIKTEAPITAGINKALGFLFTYHNAE